MYTLRDGTCLYLPRFLEDLLAFNIFFHLRSRVPGLQGTRFFLTRPCRRSVGIKCRWRPCHVIYPGRVICDDHFTLILPTSYTPTLSYTHTPTLHLFHHSRELSPSNTEHIYFLEFPTRFNGLAGHQAVVSFHLSLTSALSSGITRSYHQYKSLLVERIVCLKFDPGSRC